MAEINLSFTRKKKAREGMSVRVSQVGRVVFEISVSANSYRASPCLRVMVTYIVATLIIWAKDANLNQGIKLSKKIAPSVNKNQTFPSLSIESVQGGLIVGNDWH